MTLQTNPSNRKQMVSAISELTGIPAVYRFTPTYAYDIGCVTVNRDGTTDCNDHDTLERLIPMLIENGYLAKAPELEQVNAPEQETIQEPVATEPLDTEETVNEVSQLDISMPNDGMSMNQLRNIVFMLFSKQNLINKALGSNLLFIHTNVVTHLQENLPEDIHAFVALLDDFKGLGELNGISITEDKITVSFPMADDPSMDFKIFAMLLSKIIQVSGETKRVRPTLQLLGDNEKYLMHSWLIRIGCGGPDFKDLRRRFTNNLTGYCAFPDQSRADKHKAKYAELRRIRRKERDATAEPVETATDTSGKE
ncbi:MAG: hypothetical protein ACI4WX_08860 [Aristaeellaceae bacterium]